jgi:hypothetical protein
MIAVATLLIVLLASLIVTRVATAILVLTGLSQESARFQARSALTGAGFTTTESEAVVNHPIRRRVVMTLMLIGSAGVITVIATLLLSFVGTGDREATTRVLVLLGGLAGVLFLARSRAFDRALSRLIRRALTRWTDLDARDYAALLHLAGEYAVMEIFVKADDWTANRTIAELAPWDEGVRILGIVKPDGTYLGAPFAGTRIEPGDTLVAYGRADHLCKLDERQAGAAGDEAHRRAVEVQRRELEAAEREGDAAPTAAGRATEKTVVPD